MNLFDISVHTSNMIKNSWTTTGLLLALSGLCVLVYFTLNQQEQNFPRFLSTPVKQQGRCRAHPRYFSAGDLNCVNTLPNVIVDQLEDMPIKIPNLDSLPFNILSCLYHRYVTTIQTICTETKAFGITDRNGGYICVKNNLLQKGNCEVIIFGPDFNKDYTKQIKDQYNCSVHLPYNGTVNNKPGLISSGFNKALRIWIASQMNVSSPINLLVLTVGMSEKDIRALELLLNDFPLMFRLMQITLKMYYDPRKATELGYRKRLALLNKFYKLGFRLFLYNRELDCVYSGIERSKFVSCYTLYMIRENRTSTKHITVPPSTDLKERSALDLARFYDLYLSSVQMACKQNIRIGAIRDGGWNICHDNKYRLKRQCLVYSFGIHNDFSFDDEVNMVYGCDVYSFDPSMGCDNYKHADHIWFQNIGIGGKNYQKGTWQLRTLDSITELLHHNKRDIDILKMDVEASEWPALDQMLQSGILVRVRQLFVEFHSHNSQYLSYLEILRKIYDYGFRIFWTHKNYNCRWMIDSGFLTNCTEVYFININFS